MWSLNGAPESQISGSESYCRAGDTGVGVLRELSLVHCVQSTLFPSN